MTSLIDKPHCPNSIINFDEKINEPASELNFYPEIFGEAVKCKCRSEIAIETASSAPTPADGRAGENDFAWNRAVRKNFIDGMWKIQFEQESSRIIKRNLPTNDGNKEMFSHFSIHWFPCKPHKLIWMALVRIYCVESSIQVEASEGEETFFVIPSDLIKHKNVSIKALNFAHVESGHVNEIPSGFRVLSLLHGLRAESSL